MYLKRLELQGYKTFATKTEFEFDSGITAIVGPNGSGKSNIADALRWVMGEHRYRTLRAKRGDEMIFAGGQGRARVGMAEVTLTLDNSTGWLPIDYAEVTIQRRTNRSGETRYSLNGSRARRRDIVELLTKGGVSSNTYTIIGQGTADASVNMRPEERRVILEEAAGIAIHQQKRDQALSKLQDTQNNILRANDIINEIAPRLKRLSKQADRAREYQEASKRLEGLLETWYSYRWHRAQGESRVAGQEEESRQEKLNAERQRLEEFSRQIDQVRKLRAELRGQLGDWHSESGKLHSRLEGLQRELAVKQERQRLIRQRSHEIQQEISPLHASRGTREQRIEELESELERLAEDRRQRDSEWQVLHAELNALEGQREQLQKQLAAEQSSAFELATLVADLRNRLNQHKERRGDVNKEREDHEQASEELEDELQQLRKQIDVLDAEHEDIVAKIHELDTQEQHAKRAAQASVEKQEKLGTRLNVARQELDRLQVRNEILAKARSELADYSQAVRTVLSQGFGSSPTASTVAELVRVPAKLEHAIGAALGSLLQAVVVESWQEARRAIDLLSSSDAGRATFLPLDSLQPVVAQTIPDAPGVLGLASDLVSIEQGLEPVLRALLGQTLVVEDLETAKRLSTQHANLQCATLAGHLVSPHGALTGGADASVSLLLAHERERRELPEQIAAAQGDKNGMQLELDEEETRHRQWTGEIAALQEQRQSLEKADREKTEEMSSWRLKEERATQELEWHRVAAGRLRQEADTLQEKERSISSELAAAREKERETAERVKTLHENLQSLDVTPLQEKLGGLKTAIAVVERSKESQETALAGHRDGLRQIQSQLEEKELRVVDLGAEAEELEGTIASLTQQVEALAAEADGLSSSIVETEQQLTDLESEQGDLENGEAAGRRELQQHEAAYNKAVLKRQRSEDELRNLQERIEAELETVAMSTDLPKQLPLDIDARLRSLPAVTEVPKGLDTEIKHLRKRLRQLGPVDLEAMDEYEQVAERHSFLVGQVEDLDQAANSLHQVVTELDRVMEDQFIETFNKVAVEFESFFTRLFNGGSGELLLTDPDNPLQSGVEIVAQPPGRRRRSVAMLSGGEKVLTGVALTFAILKTCTTPFCFLDEVDARLDEVNVGRFGDSLRELSRNTQLVIITHNRGTLEKADSIYGITMSGDGASRVLSLRLEAADGELSHAAAG
jgi:chromosome segregation protein